MDAFYNFLESVHVFIPIIAVVFLVVMVFLFGLSRNADVEPPVGYIDKLHKAPPPAYKEGLPKSTAKAGSPKPKTSLRQGSKEVPSPKEAKPAPKSPEKDANTMRQRKKEKKADKQEFEAADDGEWVTVSPKKKAKSPVLDSPVKSPPVERPRKETAAKTPENSPKKSAEKDAKVPTIEELLQKTPEELMQHAQEMAPEPANDELDAGEPDPSVPTSPESSLHDSLPDEPTEVAKPEVDSPSKKSKKKKRRSSSDQPEDDGWTTATSKTSRKQRARRAD